MKKTNKKTQQVQAPKTLIQYLKRIPDFRRGQGKMHRLPTILVIVIMAIMSGYHGQRAAGDFVERHRPDLLKALKPKHNRLPSYQTIARVMRNLDYTECTAVFYAWAHTIVPLETGDWISTDGKAIRGTVKDYDTPQQQLTNVVSVFASKRKQVLTQGKVMDKASEIPLVTQLVQQLGLTGLVITADALHCQKKTVATIVSSQNDYCLGVKDNQKTLHAQLKKMAM